MEQPKEYYAFISYKREDEKWAKWLQDKLGHYRFPANLNGRTDLPKHIRPIFRDVTDLTPGFLSEEIAKALNNSEWLIVVCSPRSAKSIWVCKEAQAFIDMGRADHIIPFVIEGNPFSNDIATECYPEALLNLTGSKELLAANINDMGRDAAAIKVIARMFNLRFDALWQRYEREQKKKRIFLFGGVFLALLITIGVASYIWNQNILLKEKDWRLMENQARAVAEKANQLIDSGDSYLARLLLLQVLPNESIGFNRPYVAEAEAALRKSCLNNTAIFDRHDSYVKSVFFNHNGKIIISASWDNSIKMWDAESGRLMVSNLASSSGKKEFAVFSPDDKSVAIAEYEKGTFYKLDLRENNKLKFHGHRKGVSYLAYSPNGKYIASLSKDRTIKIWDATIGKEINSHIDNVYSSSVVFSPDGKSVVYGCNDGKIVKWNFKDNIISSFQGHRNGIHFVDVSPNGKQMVSTSFNEIKIWDMENGVCVDSLKQHSAYVNTAFFSHNGKYIVTASKDKTVKMWNVIGGEPIKNYDSFYDEVITASFSPDDKRIVSASGKTIKILDVPEEPVFDYGKERFVSYLETIFSTNLQGTKLLTIGVDDSIKVWDIDTQTLIATMEGKCSTFRVNTLLFSDDEKYVISASVDKTIKVWDALTGKEKKRIDCDDAVYSAVISPDGNCLIATLYDRTIRMWKTSTWEEIPFNTNMNNSFSFASVSSKSNLLAATNNDDIFVWNLQTNKIITSISMYTAYEHIGFNKLCFNSDGSQLLALYVDDGIIKIWDTETGVLLQSFNGVYRTLTGNGSYNPNFKVAFFSPNGESILALSSEGVIKRWSYPSLRQLINSNYVRFKNRQLTSDERRKFYLK